MQACTSPFFKSSMVLQSVSIFMSIVIDSERQYLANIGKSKDSKVSILAAMGNGLNLLLLMTDFKKHSLIKMLAEDKQITQHQMVLVYMVFL